jgi:hypothetical protein
VRLGFPHANKRAPSSATCVSRISRKRSMLNWDLERYRYRVFDTDRFEGHGRIRKSCFLQQKSISSNSGVDRYHEVVSVHHQFFAFFLQIKNTWETFTLPDAMMSKIHSMLSQISRDRQYVFSCSERRHLLKLRK